MNARTFDDMYEKGNAWGILTDFVHHVRYDMLFDMIKNMRFRNALDIGCAYGLFTKRLKRISDSVTGTDISKISVNYCKKKYKNIKFRQEDILDLKEKNKYDLIVCSETIYYMSRRKRINALRNIYNALKEDGILLISAAVTIPKYFGYDEFIRFVEKSFIIIRIRPVTSRLPWRSKALYRIFMKLTELFPRQLTFHLAILSRKK